MIASLLTVIDFGQESAPHYLRERFGSGHHLAGPRLMASGTTRWWITSRHTVGTGKQRGSHRRLGRLGRAPLATTAAGAVDVRFPAFRQVELPLLAVSGRSADIHIAGQCAPKSVKLPPRVPLERVKYCVIALISASVGRTVIAEVHA